MPPCSRCPRVFGRSCCEPGPGDRLTTLTLPDVERIAAHTGRASRTFVEEEWLTAEEALDFEAQRPAFRGYFAREPRRLTLAQRDGGCVFHTRDAGCTLPETVRPLACRLYPFAPWPDGTLALVPERHGDLARARAEGGACLAVEEAEDFEALLEAFGTSIEAVHRLGMQLTEAVHAHARASAPRADRRQRLPRRP